MKPNKTSKTIKQEIPLLVEFEYEKTPPVLDRYDSDRVEVLFSEDLEKEFEGKCYRKFSKALDEIKDRRAERVKSIAFIKEKRRKSAERKKEVEKIKSEQSLIKEIEWKPFLNLLSIPEKITEVKKIAKKGKRANRESTKVDYEDFYATERSVRVLQKYILRFAASRRLSKLRAKRNKRKNVCEELLKTEKEYISHLNLCEEIYVRPIKELIKQKLFKQADFNIIFGSGLTQLKNVNIKFCEELEKHMYDENGDYIHLNKISVPILQIAPFFKMYSQFSMKYQKAINIWKENLVKGSEKLSTALKKMEKDKRSTQIGLIGYLILPIQRIPRYRLLLKDLIKNTNVEHPDYAELQKAMEKIKAVASFLDKNIADLSTSEELRQIQEKFVNIKGVFEIVAQNRKKIFEEEAQLGMKNNKSVTIFLFDDVILFAEKKNDTFRYLEHRNLANLKVYECTLKEHVLKIRLEDTSSSNSVIISCKTQKQKIKWMSEILRHAMEVRKKRNISVVKSTEDSLTPLGVAKKNEMPLSSEECVIYIKKYQLPVMICSATSKPVKRYIQISSDEKTLLVYINRTSITNKESPIQTIAIEEVQELVTGQTTTLFKKYHNSKVKGVSFSLLFGNGYRTTNGIWTGPTFDCICSKKEDFLVWTNALKFILQDKGLTAEIRNQRMKNCWKKAEPFLRLCGNDVMTFGKGESGALGHHLKNKEADQKTPKIMRDFLFHDVSTFECGENCSFLTLSNGKPFSWGSGKKGKLGHGDESDIHLPRLIETFQNVKIVKISSGKEHTMFLDTNGCIWACGSNSMGQLGIGSKDYEDGLSVPKKLETEQTFSFIKAGNNCSCAVTTRGDVYMWGEGKDGKLGNGSDDAQYVPKIVDYFKSEEKNVFKVALGYSHGMALTRSGNAHIWGDGHDGQLGNGKKGKDNKCYTPFLLENVFLLKKVKQVACGALHSCAVTMKGKVYLWGSSMWGQVGNGKKSTSIVLPTLLTKCADFSCIQLECGVFHNIALFSEKKKDTVQKKILSWGAGTYGRIGVGSEKDQLQPKEIKTKEKVISVVAGGYMSGIIIEHNEIPISEKEQKHCWNCEKSFGFRRKRIVCKHCGGVFCKDCMRKKFPIIRYGHFDPVNVCNVCYDLLEAKNA